MQEETKAFLKLWSLVLTSLCYSYYIVSKIPKPLFRFLSLLPIFTLFTILPLTLSSVLPTAITAFFITWLANFKLLLFSFKKGPLSHHQPIKMSLLNFILISSFPIKIKYPSTQNQKPTKILPLNFWSKALIFAIFMGICDIYKNKLHHSLIFVIYSCMLYLFLDIVMGICNKLVGSIMGVELSPPSDEPYLSTSLRDFWGKRWNLMVSDILRNTIYKPTRVFSSIYLGDYWAKVLGVVMTFLVSGLMHELIFYHMARVRPTWEVTWFFVLHGLCMLLEDYLRDGLGRKLGLHRAVTGPLTVGFVLGTGYWWFFPPLLRHHVDDRATEEGMAVFRFVKGKFT